MGQKGDYKLKLTISISAMSLLAQDCCTLHYAADTINLVFVYF